MSRGRLLLLAQRPASPLGPPSDAFSAEQKQAWHDIVAACPDVLRAPDAIAMEVCSSLLARWRRGDRKLSYRELGRWLGMLFMPIRNRRRLLFPERAKSA